MKHLMTKRLFLVLLTATMVGMAIVLSSLPLIARPHEKLTYEPIQFKPPVPEVRKLSNGMTLYLLEDHELPVFDISGIVKTGTIYDPIDKIGLAAICASVMRSGGTVSREPDVLNEELESMAASVEVGMSPEYGSVSLSTMAEDIEKGLEIFADVLRNPAFRQEKLDLRKQQAIEAIRRRNDNPIQLAWRNFSSILYGKDHPFGWYSEIETVESITVEDLKAFHSKYYHPNNIMLSITGDFDTEQLINQLERVLAGWIINDIDFPDIPAVEVSYRPSVNHIQKDLPQTTMLIGHLGIKRTPDFPDYFALRVMNDILGEGGFTSRLMKQMREKHGLAYMVGSLMQTSLYTNPGEWFAYCGSSSEKTAQAISLIIDIIREMREKPVSEEELQLTKDSLINSFVFGFESSSQIAFQQMMLAYREFDPDFLVTYTDNIAKVSAEDVQAAAEKYLQPDGLTIVTVGNQDNFDRPLSEFGTVNEIAIEQPESLPTEPLPEGTASDIAKGKEIVANVVNAMGGMDKLKSVKTIVSDARSSMNTQMGRVEIGAVIYQVYPGKLRQNMTTPQGELSFVYDGEVGYIVAPMGAQPLPPEMSRSLKDAVFRDIIPLFVHLVESDVPVQFAGIEEINGESTSTLLVKQPSGETLKVYISNETHYVVKYAFRESEQGVTVNKERYYSDYREISGVKVPHRVDEYVNGILTSQSTTTSVELNIDVDESLFEISD